MRKIIRPVARNLKLKTLMWFILGTSFSFLIANADLVINPQITNSIAYIKQFFVTSDGTNAGSLGVVLQSSGVFATKYCDLSGANCKTLSELSDISAQLAGLSAIYTTSGQVNSQISLFSGQLLAYLTANYYDKTGTNALFTNYYDKTGIDSLFTDYYNKAGVDSLLAGYYTKTATNTLFTSYYTKTEIDNKGYISGAQVNSLAKTLSLNCSEGQIAKISGSSWVCAGDAIGSPQDLSNYVTSSYLSTNYYNKTSTDALFGYYYTKTDIDNMGYVTNPSLLSKGYISGSQVNLLAKTLSLNCQANQVPQYNGSAWNCADIVTSFDETDPYFTSWYTTSSDIGLWNDAVIKSHEHTNKTDLDGITATKISNWDTSYSNAHSHLNKTDLDGITATKISNRDTSFTKSHDHTNKTALDGITATKTSNWDSAYTFVNTANDSDTLKLDGSNNRVGVLTASPYKTFVAAGDVALLSNTNLSALEILSNGAIPHRRGISLDNDPSGKFSFYIHSSQNDAAFNFKDGNSDTILMTILEGGNVGIGTNSAPGYKLTVEGTGAFTHAVYSQAFLYNSDRRLKTNIVAITDPLTKIAQINGYTFDWKDSGRHDLGVIAQEVESVFPEAVVTKETGYKTVNYPSLVAPLISAVKELYYKYLDQQSQIDQLKIEINQLKLEISKK